MVGNSEVILGHYRQKVGYHHPSQLEADDKSLVTNSYPAPTWKRLNLTESLENPADFARNCLKNFVRFPWVATTRANAELQKIDLAEQHALMGHNQLLGQRAQLLKDPGESEDGPEEGDSCLKLG